MDSGDYYKDYADACKLSPEKLYWMSQIDCPGIDSDKNKIHEINTEIYKKVYDISKSNNDMIMYLDCHF